MEKVLGQSESDALLAIARAGVAAEAMPRALDRELYQFSRAGQISSEPMRAMAAVSDLFSRNKTLCVCFEVKMPEAPGVMDLDRHVSEPVDLMVGDGIVVRGEVVAASKDFALKITEVATPHLRLERIRCLF